MKKEINIEKLSEMFLSLDGDVGSDYCYYSKYINELSHNKEYLKNRLKEELEDYNLTVEEIIEDFVNTSNTIIKGNNERIKGFSNEIEELKKYKDFLELKGLDSDFNDYIKEKERLEKIEMENFKTPF